MKSAHCNRRPDRRENPLRPLDMRLLGLIIVLILFGSAVDLKGGWQYRERKEFFWTLQMRVRDCRHMDEWIPRKWGENK